MASDSARLMLACMPFQLREHHAARAIREAAAIAQARAEFLPTPSRLRHLEIESTKRGDLLAAAIYAEQSEGFHG